MNIEQAKQIDITSFLQAAGKNPKRKYPGHWWFTSPIPRHNGKFESHASFVVDTQNNLWYDKALDTGGDLISLVKLMNGTTTSGALEIIANNSLHLFSFDRQNDHTATGSGTNGITITHTQPIKNRALIQYLAERKIPVKIASRYLMEIYYKVPGRSKQYFSLGFKNDRGGYALRNQYSKTAVSPAYFTTIPGRYHDQVNIFEGFFDFLSALVYFKTDTPKLDCIVLNSTSHISNVIDQLHPYKRVNCCLDNDPTGKKVLNTITRNHSRVLDYAWRIYPDHNDFNEFLMHGKKRPILKPSEKRSHAG